MLHYNASNRGSPNAYVTNLFLWFFRSDRSTHHHYTMMGRDSDKFKYLFDSNIERELGFEEFSVHQVSSIQMSPFLCKKINPDDITCFIKITTFLELRFNGVT